MVLNRKFCSTFFFLSLVLLLVSNAYSAEYRVVDTTSEWEQGELENFSAAGGKIILKSENPSLDWTQTNFDEPVTEIALEGDFVYAVSGQDDPGYVAKLWKKNGSFIWKVQKSGSDNEWNSLDIGDNGYIYALERQQYSTDNEGVYRLDSDGNFVPGGVYPIVGPNSRKFDVEYLDGYLYTTGSSGYFSKYNATGGSTSYEKHHGIFSRELEIYSEDLIYMGDNSGLLGINTETGDITYSRPGGDFDGSIDAIERGPDDNIWMGDNEDVQKYNKDLSSQLCTYKFSDAEIPAMAEDFSGVFTASENDDRFNKLDSGCNTIWEEAPAPKGYDTMEADGRALYAGAQEISGAEDGAVDKFFKEYDKKGSYTSRNFTWSGEFRELEDINVEANLKGEDVNITVIWSNSSIFDPLNRDEKTFKLSNGSNNYNLPDEEAYKAKFRITVTNNSEKDTPRIHKVNLSVNSVTAPSKCDELGLIGCWKMEQGSGQIVYDYSDRNNHGSRGYLFSPDSEDPVWINDPSKCVSGGCLNFSEQSQITISDSKNLSFEEFSLTGGIWLDSGDGSSGNIIHKENEIQVLANFPEGNISASIYNNSVCGGWCGSESVLYGSHKFYVSDMQAEYDQWYGLKVTWNGTHFSFYDKNGLVDRGSPPSVNSYTSPEDNSEDLLIASEGRNQGNHLQGPIDQIKLFNSSEYGTVPPFGPDPGALVCDQSSKGVYTNIEEYTENTGRLKNDDEICLNYSSSDYEFFDQDYGDIDGDGVQETCRENSLYGQQGVRWFDKSVIKNHPEAFIGGIDDDQMNFTSKNFESMPDQNLWNFNSETPVPTGTSKDFTSTLGFCGGDDEGEYLITQKCNTGLCSTDNSVLGVSKSPKACVLNGQNYDLEKSENQKRKLYSQGENVTFDLGSDSQSVACFDGTWYEKWPISAGPTGKKQIGKGQTASFDFKVINVQNIRKEFRIELQGDEEAKRYVEFEGRPGNSFEISVPPRSSENIRLKVFGGNSDVDDAEIRVQAVSTAGDISGEDSFKIDITDNSISNSNMTAPQNVPGIGVMHLLVILLVSVLGRYLTLDQ